MEPAKELLARTRKVPGVLEAEAGLTVPVQVSAGGVRYELLLQGIPDGAELLVPTDFDGNVVGVKAGRVLLPREAARIVGAAPGADVLLRVLPAGPAIRARVGGLTDSIAGAVAVMRLGEVQRALGLPGQANTLLVQAGEGARPRVRRALQELPALAAFQDVDSLMEIVDTMMGLGLVMVGAMLLLAVVLAASVLFNTATLGILERRRELATQRAIGQSMRSVAAAMTLENALLGLLGLVVGLPLGVLAGRWALSYYSSDLFSLPFAVSFRTIGVSVVGVALVLLVAQWPALRAVARTDLAEACRSDDE
jgi:putative ABC transport system permease protein